MLLEMRIISAEDEIYLLTKYAIKMYKKVEEESRLVHMCELNRLQNLIKTKKADLFLLEAMRDFNKTFNNINSTEKTMNTNNIENGTRSLSVDKYIVGVIPKREISDKIDITYHIQQKSDQPTQFQKFKGIVSSFLKTVFRPNIA